MIPNSRRIVLYWMLLLLPTLAVGAGAVLLLRREQAALNERGAMAETARRTAATARAGLIVENAELLAGDIQTGLLDTLAAEPASAIDAFLATWETNNPLVRVGFRATADGRLLRPTAAAPDENQRGFARRFPTYFSNGVPWTDAAVFSKATRELKDALAGADEAVSKVQLQSASNAGVAQTARRDANELARQVYQTASAPAPAAAERSRAEADAGLAAPAKAAAVAAVAAKKEATGTDAGARGWQAVNLDGRLHLLGWMRPGNGSDVRGLELNPDTFIQQLKGALPAEVNPGEGFALRDAQGRIHHQVGALQGGTEPVARIPLGNALLSGWEAVAFLAPAYPDGAGGGFATLGMGLVIVAVLAILGAGSLLLLQARRSGEEAALKTSFVANVSHEFKTPLTNIRLYSELLEQGRVRDPEQGRDYLRTIGRETQRLARLVNNVLDFSRLEQGRKKYASEKVDLAVELERLLGTQMPRLGESGMILRWDLPHGPPVSTDRDAVEQIVLNLLDNAAKYAGGGGEVLVTLSPRPGGGVSVRIADRGPGVPAEHRNKIFEKFHRVDETLTADRGGAGLGLSIARQLARGLGGELRCEPRSGGGAVFILELP